MPHDYHTSRRQRRYARVLGFLAFIGLALSGSGLWHLGTIPPAAAAALASSSVIGIPVLLLFIGFRVLYMRDPVAASRALKSVFFDIRPFG